MKTASLMLVLLIASMGCASTQSAWNAPYKQQIQLLDQLYAEGKLSPAEYTAQRNTTLHALAIAQAGIWGGADAMAAMLLPKPPVKVQVQNSRVTDRQ